MDRTLLVRMVASTAGFRAELGKGVADVRNFGREVASSVATSTSELAKLGHTTQKTAQSLQPLGTAMLTVGAGIAAGLGLSVNAAIDFEAAMRNTNSIMGESEAQFARTSDSVRALSRDLPQSATDLARGLYDIASSGFQGAEGLEVLEQSARAATAGLTDTATSSSAIVGALNAYGLTARDAADVSDILFATVDKGVITFPQLAQGLGEWVGTAHAAGIALDEASAALATMTVNGVNASEAGVSLNRVILAFINPSTEMGVALHQIGFESGAAALQSLGLQGAMQKLSAAGFNNVTALQALFPEVRGLRGALALTANEGTKFAEIAGDITSEVDRAGSTQRAFAEQSKSTAVQLALLRNNLTDLAIGFGQALLPVLRITVELLGALLDGFRAMPAPLRALIAGGTVLVGVVTLLGGGFLFLLPRIQATQAALATLAVEAPVAATALRTVTVATGAVGLGLTVVSAAYAIFAANQNNAADTVNHMTEAFEAFAHGQSDVATRLTLEDLAAKDVLGTLEDLGITTQAVTEILTTHQDGTAANVAATKAWDAALRDAVSSGKLTQSEADALSRTVFKLANDFANTAGDTGDVDSAVAGLGITASATAEDVGGLSDEVKTFKKSLDDLYGSTFSVGEASDKFASDLAELRDNILAAKEAGDANAASLNANSVQGLRNRDTLRGLAQDALDVAAAMKEQGAAPAAIAVAMDRYRAAILQVASDIGLSTGEAQQFVDLLLRVDGITVQPTVNIDTGQAVQSLDDVLNKLNEISAISGDIGPIVASLVGGSAGAPVVPSSAPTAAPSTSKAKDKDQAVTDFLKAQFEQRVEIAKNFFEITGEGQKEYLKLLDEQLAHEVAYTDRWRQLMDERNRIAREGMRTQRMLQDTLTGGYFQAKPGEEAMRARAAMGSSYQLAPSYTTASSSNSTSTTIVKNYTFGDIATAQDIDGAVKEAERMQRSANLTQTGVGGGW